MTIPADRPGCGPAARWITRSAAVLAACVAAVPLAYSTTANEVDLAALRDGKAHQAHLLVRTATDPDCAARYELSELDGDGEHTVYRTIDMPGEVTFRLRARAVSRYGLHLGFASHDWNSYSYAAISLISGAHTVVEGGALKSVRASAEARPDGWVDINFTVADRGRTSGTTGFAFIKLTANGGHKAFPGRPVEGVELCSIRQ